MKKFLTLFIVLIIVGTSFAQRYIFQPLDNSVASGYWDLGAFYNNQGSATAKMDLSDNTADKKEGSASLKVDYLIGAGDGWGGFIVRVTPNPLANYMNLSTGTALTFWYKVTKPVVTTKPGTVFMELKIGDVDSDNKRDLWFREMPVDLADASGQWKQVTVSLDVFKDGGDKSKEWALQFGDGDREIQLDKIKTMELALVYITGGSGTNTPTAAGTILFDSFAVTGDRYSPPILTFVNQAASFTKTWSSGTGGVTLTNEATEKVEGTTGSMKVDYTCDASEGWGGVTGFEIPAAAPTKFVERTNLSIFIKNTTACVTTVPKRAVLRMYIYEGDNGEQWVTKIPIDLTKISDWTRYNLPLKQGVNGNNNSDQYPPVGAFARNPNGPKVDETFNPEKMTKIKFEFIAIGAGGPDSGPKGEKLIGNMYFGILQQSGYQLFDIIAPVAPTGVNVVGGNYSNLITWNDIPGETTEKYFIYASKTLISSLTAPGVELVAGNIARGTQVFEHLLRTPKTDKYITYFYAVRAIDKAGNAGPHTLTGGASYLAKGIPTIPILTPPSWKADGALTEWAGVTPFRIKVSDGSGHIMTGFTINNDADCSADFYLAMDKEYMYFAVNVTDDIVFNDISYLSKGSSWALDCADIEIGLYNQPASQHRAYKHGTEPDYHFRFNKDRARSDHWESEKDSLLMPGANYYWQEKFPSGYMIEGRLKFSDMIKLRKTPANTKDTIFVKEGYKIPLQLLVCDNDGLNSPELWKNREGQIGWSPFDNDAGWQYPNLWMYTWLGNTDVVTTDVEEEKPFTFSLDQNYPNPFNPVTQIKYSIASPGLVTLKVYDILGRQVADLVNAVQDAGKYTVNFNASKLASGVYIYRIESGSFTDVKKMMVLK